MFGSSSSSNTTPPAAKLRVQTSVAGLPRPIVWGQARISGNLLWYGDFHAWQAGSGGKGGGKGGSGGKGGGGSGYNYAVSIILGICEGPASATGRLWSDQKTTTLAKAGLTWFSGTYAQAEWGWTAARHPSQSVAYRGLAYAAGRLGLGTSPSLPNMTLEVIGPSDAPIQAALVAAGDVDAGPDAAPDYCIADYLTNPHYGAGFPASFIGDLTVWRNFCLSYGIVVSPALDTQQEGRQFITDLMTATASEVVWSSGKLTVVPYGDMPNTGYGHTYTPPGAPLFSLNDDDFKSPQGGNPNSVASSSAADPVQVTRKRPSEQMNQVSVEYLQRSGAYNPTIVVATDDAAVNDFGLRPATKTTPHMICDRIAAQASAQLQLGRQQVRNTYTFTVGPEYIVLDPMDIVAISDAVLGLVAQWVRITEITEQQNGCLVITAEDYLEGTGAPALHADQASLGAVPQANSDAGATTQLVIWEPTYALSGAFEVWLAPAGITNWAGADIWVSGDGNSYTYAGTLAGAAACGVLTAALPAVPMAVAGATIDAANTLAVDMGNSGAQLLSVTQADALNANAVCYVDGEYLSFQTATLTSGAAYALTWLVRGLYDTTATAHSAGAAVVKLVPGSVLRFALSSDRVGQQFFFKVLPLNYWGGGQPSLADVPAWPYTVRGTALAQPLVNVTGLTAAALGAYTYLSWQTISDFRAVLYEIRMGASWATAMFIARVGNPPYVVPSTGTFWVAGYSNPEPDIVAYSATPSSIVVGTSFQTSYPPLKVSYDEYATGWTGAITGALAGVGGLLQTSGSGAYEVPAGHQIDIGRVAAADVLIVWAAIGASVAAASVLTVADWLGDADILGWSLAGAISAQPQIAISQDAVTWGAWQDYVPGAYTGRKFKARMQVASTNPAAVAILEGFAFTVAPPVRADHCTLSVPAGGLAVAYTPDGAATAAAFLCGPIGSGTLPALGGTIVGASAGDDLVITGASLSGCTVRVFNAGAGVARTVSLVAEGF